MQIGSRIEKLTDYRNFSIFLDISRVLRYRGKLRERRVLDKEFALMFRVVGAILFITPFIITVVNGEFSLSHLIHPQRIIFLLPYFAILPIMYSFFLMRDRDNFRKEVYGIDLKKYSNYTYKGRVVNWNIKLEISQFLTDGSMIAIDSAFHKNNKNFIQALLEELLKDKYVYNIVRNRLGVDGYELLKKFNEISNNTDLNFNTVYKDILLNSMDIAIKLGVEQINEIIILIVINKLYLEGAYRFFGVNDFELEGLKFWYQNFYKGLTYYNTWKKLSRLKPKGDINKSFTSRQTTLLDKYSDDFTRRATSEFIMSVGREKEMNDVLQIISKENDSSILILGDVGVGKTRFIHYLATRMVIEDVPYVLKDSRLVVLDLNRIMTECESMDDFKRVLDGIFKEVVFSRNIILVFEDFGQIFSIRQDFKLEVVNLILNSIQKDNIKVIATTNNNDYAKYIQPLAAIDAAFQVINYVQPDRNLSLQILIDETPVIEQKYKVNIELGATKRVVELSSKFDVDRVMPDKGISLLQEGVINAKANGLNYLDSKQIDELVSKKVGVQIGAINQDEKLFFNNLDSELHKRVVGQNEAISLIVNAVKRARAGLTGDNKPQASFLFYGPTGVGKTEVSKALAQVYYGDEKFMIRVDMSEYQEEQNLNKLIGYSDANGNFIGGILSEAVRNKPFSLILLDEIEKANKKVLDLFLQVLDEGNFKDGVGREIDFTNTIIIMTSNVGSKQIADLILSGNKYYDVEKVALEDLRSYFRVEFLNRFDKLIMFTPLTNMNVREIIELNLKQIKERLLTKGMDMLWNDKTLDELSKSGYDPNYGARELRRSVNESIEDLLAKLIIDGDLKQGNEVVFDGLIVSKII